MKKTKVILSLSRASLQDFIHKIEIQTPFRFTYDEKELPTNKEITINVKEEPLNKVLDHIAAETGLEFKLINSNIHIRHSRATETQLSPKASSNHNLQNQVTVTGRVTDKTGAALPGVTVLLKGTSDAVPTNTDGNYTITVPNGSGTLVYSYIGYQSQEVPINNRTSINVTLEEDSRALEEVVVVGYGTQKRSDVTGSVGVVSSEELLRAPVTNALQGLQGRIAGVNVKLNSGSPTSSPRVIIRGVGTINASSGPLYVVDGVVMEDIQFLNPNDIQSMEVLKDASSTAIYGARGANGVILVTTRRGATTEGVVIGYDGWLSVGQLRKKMDLLNAQEWLQVVGTGMANTPKYRPESDPVFTRNDPRLFDANGNPLYDTDWQDEATRTAISHNHQLSLQSKSEKSSFGTFLNYAKLEGIMLNSWLERINGKLAYDATPKKWLSIGANILVNYTRENEAEEGGGHQMPRRTMIEMPPIFPVKFPDGTWSNSSMISDAYNLEGMANPVHVLETQERLRNRTQLFGNTYLTFHILPGLDLRTQFGFDRHDRKFQEYYPTDLLNISSPLGRAYLQDQIVNYWQEETFLSYNKELGKHRINSVLGLSWQQRTYESNSVEARGFGDDFFKYNRIQAASQPGAPQSDYDEWTMNSYFLRSGYTYNDKYLVTFTGRIDGSSRFGESNKYGFFPSLGLGWVISNEPFLQNIDVLNQFKLRTSYGITGNTEIPTYQSLATVSSGTVLIGGGRAPESYVNRLPNQDLKWERTKQFDVGFNAMLFNHRLELEFDYYYKLTTDLLLDRPVPHTTGFTAVRDNIGSVSNRGIEALISTVNIENSNFNWRSTLNFNYNKNRIEKLGENNEDIEPGPWWVSGSQTILRVGESLSSFWGYERLGIWGTDEVEAAARVGAVPGEAKRATQKTILGKGLPDWSGSFINNFSYKNFDLSVDLQFVYGVDILQQFYHSTEDRSGIANGLRTILTEGWTPQNQNTMVQEIRNQAYAGQNSEIDSRWVANGSYLRGNLITFGYNFGNNFMPGLNLKGLRVYGSIQNAFVVHSDEFQGYDPEATSWGGDQWGQNIFFFQYPRPRTYTLGFNVKF
ncbi:SusC/RagA family TonB-linked outer membrane protein [Pontibacter sp. SGAir0037]|nr:SusC/RagA family TonB-linked outer membrane protein [Pontibacter sp. SGAir0037]